jgi:hypothetical protein
VLRYQLNLVEPEDLIPIRTNKTRHAAGLIMAGGLGFEPRLVVSETTVLPLDDPPNSGLTFGELRGATCLVQTNFLTLYLTGIAGNETGTSQAGPQFAVVLH